MNDQEQERYEAELRAYRPRGCRSISRPDCKRPGLAPSQRGGSRSNQRLQGQNGGVCCAGWRRRWLWLWRACSLDGRTLIRRAAWKKSLWQPLTG